MDYKIIQIIPASGDLYAKYSDGDEDLIIKVQCLALIEYQDGDREVKAMDCTFDGQFDICTNTSNFIGLFSKE